MGTSKRNLSEEEDEDTGGNEQVTAEMPSRDALDQ